MEEKDREITKSREAQERLAESEARYRDLFENVHDLIQSVGPDGRFIYVNNEWVRIMGYTMEDIKNISMFDILHPDCLGHCMEFFKKVISGMPQKNISAVFVAKDGRSIEVEGNVSCRIINGKPTATHAIFRDVTEKNRIINVIKESEEKYRSLFENATDAVFLVDPYEGRFIDCNSNAADRLGYTKEELLSLKVYDINPSSVSSDVEMRMKRQHAGESITFETSHRRKDGGFMPVEISSKLIEYGDKKVMLSFARDITERKKSEQELLFSEEMYRSLVESTENSIYLLDENYNYLFMNQHHLSRRKLSKSDYIGKTYGDFHSDKDTEEFSGILDKVFETGESLQQEYEIPDKKKYFLRTLSPVRDKAGAVIAVTVISKDITDRKEFEYELQLNEERYRSLVESTEDSIYLIDKNYKYLFMNKQHYNRLGISGDYAGRSYPEIHSPAETKDFTGIVDEVFDTGLSIQQDHRSYRSDMFFLRTLSPVKDKDGKVVAVTVLSKNITDRKRMEQDLRTLAITDELTGLYNRRGFLTLAGQQLKLASRLGRGILLFYADLDDLKTINDQYGHQEGDVAIKDASVLLKEVFRESDIIARIGGDEFVVFPVQLTDSSAETLNSRFIKHLDDFNKTREGSYDLSMSIGIVYYKKCDYSIEELLVQADKLMYEKKKDKYKKK